MIYYEIRESDKGVTAEIDTAAGDTLCIRAGSYALPQQLVASWRTGSQSDREALEAQGYVWQINDDDVAV